MINFNNNLRQEIYFMKIFISQIINITCRLQLITITDPVAYLKRD